MTAIRSLLCIPMLLIGACAHAPRATINYHLARSDVSFKVIRTVACDSANNPIVASAVLPQVAHFADPSRVFSIPIEKLSGVWTDVDTKFDFYDDGRLKGVNTSAVGQGESVVKAFVSFADSVLLLGVASPYKAECAKITAWGDKKPLSLTYVGDVKLDQTTCQPLNADESSDFYAKQLPTIMGSVCAKMGAKRAPATPVTYVSKGEATLTLRQPGSQDATVEAQLDGKEAVELWSGQVAVAQAGTEYMVPLPKPATFGKQVFSISLSETGSLVSIQYSTTPGDSQALAAGTALAGALQGQSEEAKLAELKTEVDIKAQLARKVKCDADPLSCT